MSTTRSVLAVVLTCAILAPAGRAQTAAQRTFPNAPQGFDVRREGVSRGRAADQILDNLIADKKALPMIVVMPNGRASNEPVADPPVPRVEMQAHAAFEQELIADLIPFIESHYAADRSRERRALAGLSLGGWQSLSFGLGNLNTFACSLIFVGFPRYHPP